MEWPSSVADGDVVIVREETQEGVRFVVQSRLGARVAYRTYAEAETRAITHVVHARAHVWYADGRRLQLVHPLDLTPAANHPVRVKEQP
jgi:hypothetical protein